MRLLIVLSVLLGTLLSGSSVPEDDYLSGEWGYSGNRFVFMDKKGSVPEKKSVDLLLSAMGASSTNCVLTFSEGHRCKLRLGEKSVDLDWTLDRKSAEFKATMGVFTMKGYLVREGDSIVLVYSRSNLFMIMRFLCTKEGRKQIPRLGELLDVCEGLTLGMEFSR